MRDATRQGGFTLVELMVTVAILGILTTIAVPSYRDYVIRGALGDAMSNLATKRVQNEQWYQDSRTYTGAPGCTTDSTSSKYFSFTCPDLTSTSYTLQAVGTGIAAGFTYTLDQNNNKATTTAPAGWTTNATCWVRSRSGC